MSNNKPKSIGKSMLFIADKNGKYGKGIPFKCIDILNFDYDEYYRKHIHDIMVIIPRKTLVVDANTLPDEFKECIINKRRFCIAFTNKSNKKITISYNFEVLSVNLFDLGDNGGSGDSFMYFKAPSKVPLLHAVPIVCYKPMSVPGLAPVSEVMINTKFPSFSKVYDIIFGAKDTDGRLLLPNEICAYSDIIITKEVSETNE